MYNPNWIEVLLSIVGGILGLAVSAATMLCTQFEYNDSLEIEEKENDNHELQRGVDPYVLPVSTSIAAYYTGSGWVEVKRREW